MKPRVLHVAAFANPSGGGFISSLARLGRDPAFETVFLCPRGSARFPWTRRLEENGVRVLYASSSFEVAASVVRAAPDVVHAHFVDWMVPAALGAKVARARVAWHFHSGAVAAAGSRDVARRLKYASARRIVDRFFCVSPDVVEYLLGYGVPPSRIVELPNGVDLEHFRPPNLRERAAARRRFAIAPRERVLVFFGRDAEIKGADRLAAALATMPDPPRILLVAASPQTKRILAAHAPIDAGQLADVREAYRAADALALPSRQEGAPYTLLEARACGIPCVASPLTGVLRSHARDPGTILADAASSERLAGAIEQALLAGPVSLPDDVARTISLGTWCHALRTWYRIEAVA